MPNFREYSAKLVSMSGMRRVTSTMKMVAASHLHRAQTELHQPEPFAIMLRQLSCIMRLDQFKKHPLCTPKNAKKPRILLMVMCSDRGLCGAFNSTIIREVRRWHKEQIAERDAQIQGLYAGLKGYVALWREIPPCMKSVDLSAHPKIEDTSVLSTYAMNAFMAGQFDEIWIAGNKFVSTLKHETTIRRLLPYDLAKLDKIAESKELPTCIIEPLDNRLIEALMRQWLHYSVYQAQLNRAASEQASRVMAMENATVNLRRMEKELILQRNRARQAAITNELTEIVSGAESLG